MARSVIHDLAGQASLGEETSSWSYRHDRDLTGFIDGSENPTLLDAPGAALLPEGVPGAAGTILLLQKWKHKIAEWEALPLDQQERIMGHTKLDSMAGLITGTRDALTRFTQPLTGSYYFVPSVESLRCLRDNPRLV